MHDFGCHGLCACCVHVLVNGVEHTSDQKGPPPHHDLGRRNHRLNIVKREIRPGRREVIKYFQRFHSVLVLDKDPLNAYCLLAPVQVLSVQMGQGGWDRCIRCALVDEIWQPKVNIRGLENGLARFWERLSRRLRPSVLIRFDAFRRLIRAL